jgi:F-box/leucine-rich repeat protein 2/20
MDLEECILITDASLSQLAAQCPCLESLSLSHCELITDEGIRHLGASPCASESLTVLGTRTTSSIAAVYSNEMEISKASL